jgi:hypothetical protein
VGDVFIKELTTYVFLLHDGTRCTFEKEKVLKFKENLEKSFK